MTFVHLFIYYILCLSSNAIRFSLMTLICLFNDFIYLFVYLIILFNYELQFLYMQMNK